MIYINQMQNHNINDMRYLIAIDSDGTLRHSDGTITSITKDVINNVIQKGNIVVVCTARPRYHTSKIANEINANQYFISSNGTEIFDNINNEIIDCSYISSADCKKIFEDVSNMNIRAIFVCDNTEYVTQFTRNDSQTLLNSNNFCEVLSKGVKQIMIIGSDKEKIKKYKQEVEEQYKLRIIDTSNDKKEEIWFSIISKDASKGTALEKLAKYLSIPIQNTIAIGNDNNDLSMIKAAGVGVAVSNATIVLKNNADKIIDSNDEDGIAKYLSEMFL